MKKFFLATFAFATLGLLNACNGIGEKDTLLARIDEENVYQEDFDMALMNEKSLKMEKNRFLYEKLYSRAALVSRALQEYPELKAEWDEYYREIKPRILMMVYQRFYATERMTYSDEELLRFYNANRALFPNDSVGGYRQVRYDVASLYYASKNPEKFAEFLKFQPQQDSLSSEDSLKLKKNFADKSRRDLQSTLSENILEKGHIRINNLPEVSPKEFYEKHKDMFMTVPGYELYHVQGDSLALAGLFAETVTLEQFKAAAVARSKNTQTAKDSGYVGKVKKDYALPYGIGMIPNLDSVLEGQKVGFVTPVIRSKDSYHRFFLASLVPSKLKDFDRVKAGIEAGIKSGVYFDADSSAELIYDNDKPVLTEKDLVEFYRRHNKNDLTLSIHNRFLTMFAESFAFANVAVEQRLDLSWEFRALERLNRINFIVDRYVEKKQGKDSVPEDSLRTLYSQVGSPVHVGYSYEDAKDDLKGVAVFPRNLISHEYYMGYRMIYKGKTYEQSISPIFARRYGEWLLFYKERLAAEAYERSSVHLYDSSLPEYKPRMLASKQLHRADSLYEAGKRSEAYYVYRSVMYGYAEVDSLFERVAYSMAQVQAENEEYLDAEAEYYAFYRMWPNSPNAEKSMFSRGFILNENLGMNDKALEVLEEFLQKYPKSELRESAEWLVNNIKSNGKLAEDLMKKIESEQ